MHVKTPDIDINKVDDGDSALIAATVEGHTEIIQLLLDAGATPLLPPFTRGSEDQIGIHTDQKCNEGHGLIRFNTPSAYGCDLCEQGVPKDNVMYGCEICDYDICTSCERT